MCAQKLKMANRDSLEIEQVGAPTVPSAVIDGSMNLKTFRVTDMSKCHIVSQCVTSISLINFHFLAFFGDYWTFFCHSVTLRQGVTHVMGVTLVTYVTLVTNIQVMCHLSFVIK
jgi:hypothetical protein